MKNQEKLLSKNLDSIEVTMPIITVKNRLHPLIKAQYHKKTL